MKKHFLQISSVLTLSVLVTFAMAPTALAEGETVVVSDNGAKSENSVNINQSQETNVQQNNDAVIVNNVQTSTDTGGNTANFNTGGSHAIVTGDAKAATQVSNQANTNVVDAGCCPTGGSSSTTVVSGNGAFSNNAVNHSSNNTTSVTTTNNAKIVNNVNVNANTGKNSADFNTGGDTKIITGDAVALTKINNNANVNKVRLADNGATSLKSFLKIAGNGAFSDNVVNVESNDETNITTHNFAKFINNVDVDANTGKNSADFNTGGDTKIITGDAVAQTLINNVANFNLVEIVCGCEEKKLVKKDIPNKPKEEIPAQPQAPAPPTTSVGGPGPGPSAPSAPAPVILPVTGNSALVLFLLANIAMFFLGTYLRLRSGNSPGSAPAL